MTGAIIMMVIMAVPITAIVSNAILKYKKLSIDRNTQFSDEELNIIVESLKKLKSENKELNDRIQLLESKLESSNSNSASTSSPAISHRIE